MHKSVIMVIFGLVAVALIVPAIADANPGVRIVPQGFGYKGTDSVRANEDVIFQMYITNDENLNFMIQHGFRIYSPDGAVWSGPLRWDTLDGSISPGNFDLALLTKVRHGVSEDTAGILGAYINGPGVPAFFSGRAFSLHIGSFSDADIGKRICIDSTFLRPANPWFWCGTNGANPRYPDWSGPYCFTIVRCCYGLSGDMGAVGTPGYVPDIGDLTRMIDYLFGGIPMSTCPGEVDLDRSGSVDINDLQTMAEFLFADISISNCP